MGHDVDPLHAPFGDFNFTHLFLAAIIPFLIFSVLIRQLRKLAYITDIFQRSDSEKKLGIDSDFTIHHHHDEDLGSFWNLIPGQN